MGLCRVKDFMLNLQIFESFFDSFFINNFRRKQRHGFPCGDAGTFRITTFVLALFS
jgi:hypothetical protein